MASNFPWGTTNTQTLASANGGSISAGAAVAAGTDLDNTTNRDDTCLLEVYAQLGSTAAVGDVLDGYLVPKADGTDAATSDLTTPTLQVDHMIGSFMFTGANTSLQRMTASRIEIDPILYTLVLVNRTSKSVSSGWTAKAYTWQHAAT